ncbi:MAG: hypothetical protein HOI89_03145 [Phycisphaerae bacterium]|nr:hypothetical protein [Phycisphaerae bacterium]
MNDSIFYRAILASSAVVVAGTSLSFAASRPFVEFVGDFGTSAANSIADGVPDMLYRDTNTGEVVVIYMHAGMDRPLAPVDLNAAGGVFFGEGTIGSIEVLNDTTEYDVSSNSSIVTVDDWGTGGGGLDVSVDVTGPVVAVEVLDGGSGYHDTGIGYFDIDETGTGGSGLDLVYTTLAGTLGEVRKVVIANGGSGYEPGAELALLNSNLLGHPGDPFTGLAYVNDEGVVDRVDIVARGTDFSETPGITILPAPEQGEGVEFQAFLAGAIDQVLLTPGTPDAGGSGYSLDPILTPQGDGVGFEYSIVRRGVLTGATILNPGGGYVVAPQLAVDDLEFGNDLLPVLWDDLDPANRPETDVTGRVVITDSTGLPTTLIGRHWHVYTGDIDGDGDLDLLWRRDKGSSGDDRLSVWIMDGGTRTEALAIDPPAPGWLPWKLGDLDGDRRRELLWWEPTTGLLASWSIDPDVEGFISDDSVLTGNGDRGSQWSPWVVIPGIVGENDQVGWRDSRTSVLSIADYAERDLSQLISWNPIQTTDGEVVSPGMAWRPWRVGDLNGDGERTDILGLDLSTDSISAWQMSGSTLLSAANLEFSGRDIRQSNIPRSILTRSDAGLISVSFGDGGIATLGATPQVRALPGTSEMTELTDLLDELVLADDDDVTSLLDDVTILLESTPELVDYLLIPAHANQLLSGLTDYQQHSIGTDIAELADRTVLVDSSTSRISAYQHVAMSGLVSEAVPGLQPLPEDEAGSSGDGSGSGGAGGEGGNSIPGGDGGSGGSSGGSGLPGDGSSGGGDGSGSSGGLPDNFDPNDPDTWPAGIDTFEELLQWLIDNPDINA